MDIKELVLKMTLEEKASLCSGLDYWHTKPVDRLGIPSMMMSDGPHGLRKQEVESDHLGLNGSVPATCFPTAAGLANSWDEELIEKVGAAIGREAAAEGVSIVLGPGCNIKRNPLCGRNFEYFSEDPYLSGKCAAALIRGIQSNGIAACVKHFAANSQELRRMTNDSVVDERSLREIYLPSFETAVKEGGVKCLMTSYNRLNGEYTNENTHLLRDVLYGDWGYNGMVVTDWGGNNDRVKGLIAGDNLEMPTSNGQTDRHIVEAVKNGSLSEELLNQRVEKILALLYDTRPHAQNKYCDKMRHHSLACDAAAETFVLLKNDGILPLKNAGRIAVIGDFAKTPRYQGAGSSLVNCTKLENTLTCLKSEGVPVIGYEPGFKRGGGKSARLLSRACELAMRADTVLLFLGLDEGSEAEGLDRGNMRLPDNQLELISALSSVGSRIVVVLSCGGVVEMPWADKCSALVHAYLGGQAGALALVRLLTGKANFSGKLSETVPMRYDDVPSAPYYPGREATSEYREGIFVGYRYYDTAKVEPLFPFGYGLSYTRFAYSDLTLSHDGVSFTVKNVGGVKGAEVAQLYVSAKTTGMFRPEKELKGFARVELEPGEEKTVTIKLNDRSFAVWSITANDWVIEKGEYVISVGASSRDIRLTETITKGGTEDNPYKDSAFAPYYTADIKAVPDESFRALLGHDIPPRNWDRSAPLGFNDAVSQGEYLSGGIGRFLYKSITLSRKALILMGKRMTAANLMYVLDVPYRNISRMAKVFDDEQVYALLRLVNREKGALPAFVKAMRKPKS